MENSYGFSLLITVKYKILHMKEEWSCHVQNIVGITLFEFDWGKMKSHRIWITMENSSMRSAPVNNGYIIIRINNVAVRTYRI